MLGDRVPDARLLILPAAHGDNLGEIVTVRSDSRYPELSAALIEEFLNLKP